MIPEGVDVFGRRALVTAAPYFVTEPGGAPVPSRRAPQVGEEVAIVGADGPSHLEVVGREVDESTLVHRDCLTLVPPQPVPLDPIGPEVAAHVLWHYRQLGYPPGSFVTNLIRTIAGADPGNRRLLARAFPAYVRAVSLAADHLDGIDRLRQVLLTRVPI